MVPSGMPLASTTTERLTAPFAPVHRASSRFLPTAGSLGDAAVHRQIGQLQPDETIVGIEGDLPEILHQPEFDPLITPATQRALRARLVGDPFVSAAEHQDLDQLPEAHLVGDARAVTSERMVRLSLGQEGTKLLPDGLLLMYGGTAGTMHTPYVREA